MQLGMIGLGRMGANILRRVMQDGHTGVAFDTNPESVDALAGEGATGAKTLEEFVAALMRLASDPDLRRRMGANARRTIEERYSAEVVSRKFADVVRMVAR